MNRIVALLAIAPLACRSGESSSTREPPPPPVERVGSAMIDSGSARGEPPSSGDYVPAEFKSGMARWKDTVVYLDGRPIGYLTFGELPVALKPYWLKVRKSQNKPASCPTCLAWKWGEQRYYRFVDYLKAMDVPIAKIKQLHVQGPRVTETIVATAKDLLSPNAQDFLFHFGGDVSGKAIPRVPPAFGNGIGPDKITSVMIYVTKTPPTFDDTGYVLDGKPIDGVPYYGEPLRGGVRIYLDDHLAAIIKRQELDVKKAKQATDGSLSWSLYQFLNDRGVDTSKVVEGWIIRDDLRRDRIPASELATMWFAASSQASGTVALGDKKLLANALALHTRELKPDELPALRDWEKD